MKYYSLLLILVFFFSSCDNDTKKNNKTIDRKRLKESLVKVNTKHIDVENTQINDFMRRRHWNDFKKSKTGLRYNIYKEGIGIMPIPGSKVGIEYSIIDIKGNKLYDSETQGYKIFEIDKNEEPTGLNEALKLMKVGGRAKLIVPSYLAYGLLGDENKIGQKATLIYDVYLVEVQ